MKSIGILSTSAVFVLVGLSVPALSRQEPQAKTQGVEETGKLPQQPEEKSAPKQERQEPSTKPVQQEHPAQSKPAAAPKQEPHATPQPTPQHSQQTKTQQEPEQKQQAAKSEKQPAQQHTQQQVKAQQESQKQQPENSGNSRREQQQATVSQPQQNSNPQGPHRSQQDIDHQHAQPALRLSSRGSGHIPDERFHSNFGRGHEFHMGNPVMVSGYSRFQYGGYWFGYVQPWPTDWYYTDDVYIDYVDGGYYMFNPYYPGARFALTVVI